MNRISPAKAVQRQREGRAGGHGGLVIDKKGAALATQGQGRQRVTANIRESTVVRQRRGRDRVRGRRAVVQIRNPHLTIRYARRSGDSSNRVHGDDGRNALDARSSSNSSNADNTGNGCNTGRSRRRRSLVHGDGRGRSATIHGDRAFSRRDARSSSDGFGHANGGATVNRDGAASVAQHSGRYGDCAFRLSVKANIDGAA